MQKAADYERIQHTLRAMEQRLRSDDDGWIQDYLDLGDRALNIQRSALGSQSSATKAVGT